MKSITSSPAKALLNWYDLNRRVLPWRAEGGVKPEPYHVWLSEVMLQQTTVATVKPRFYSFLERWPTVMDLAAAPLDDVLHEWQGLGYYARARNLHRCAQVVAQNHGGIFPDEEESLLTLPGVGDYTAAAIAAIAFGRPSAPVDGNIIRVISRLFAIDKVMPAGKDIIRAQVMDILPVNRAGDFAQAMMDLGATVCKPKVPLCTDCPWQPQCKANAQNEAAKYPVKPLKKTRPTRYGAVFWLENDAGDVLVQRREEKGLLGGMMEFPSSPWDVNKVDGTVGAPMENIVWTRLDGNVTHTFTHFHLVLDVLKGSWPEHENGSNTRWVAPDQFSSLALPTVMKKVAKHVKAGST